MNLPELRIDNLVARVPIVQGGMGVGISLSSLAGNVALNGGIGVISGVEPGFNEPDYLKNKKEANIRALRMHIQKARDICKDGILGVNIMVVLNNFEEMVAEAVKQKIDIIFSGAGLPLKLPQFTMGSDTKNVPIVSSGRAAAVICKSWHKHYGVVPDAIVVEGPLAGGHLGFSEEEIKQPSFQLINLLRSILDTIKPYEELYRKKIPVIAAGGVFNGQDIANLIQAGASGVQMGTRFVATHECDASDEFKKVYLDATSDDVQLIHSPVGMIGRAVRNKFLIDVEAGKKKPIRCLCNCLKPCNPAKAPYCIADALINAQRGNFDNGFAFAGTNVYRIKEIVSVKQLMDELVSEAKYNLQSI
ncbi:nitronate monooxygenase family protein [Tepidanaerobacter sp. EBM-38]|uniref:NAD(P)H-dependent flavin oxidoreductase n=1 Tax=Tepidanaerobacter sp. EBM-38 TaxID=1918496 RepID=UPI000A9295A9|nr:nitronate monooxygenase family protein [Tepidanaerobacter sp. EBM-38]